MSIAVAHDPDKANKKQTVEFAGTQASGAGSALRAVPGLWRRRLRVLVLDHASLSMRRAAPGRDKIESWGLLDGIN